MRGEPRHGEVGGREALEGECGDCGIRSLECPGLYVQSANPLLGWLLVFTEKQGFAEYAP